MTRLLITGAGGQVGRELVRLAGGQDARAFDRVRLDITDARAVEAAIADAARGARLTVINAAAYTAVDRAESEPEVAFAVNRDGAAYLAASCQRYGARLVHLSTDYVFDGEKGAPYTENDAPNPLNVYGESKLAGEEAIRQRTEQHVILRTAWVFSAHGRNFVRTMYRLAHEREVLRVVADQTGHPTPARAVAEAALRLAQPDAEVGTVHFAGTPSTTWHRLAEAVVEATQCHGSVAVQRVEPIPTEAYPTPARRPREVVLAMDRAREIYGLEPPNWSAGLPRVIATFEEETNYQG
ncbi:MAG: dTDP-4-dehydrorhamnose reductase [Bacteroidota bacterium]